MRAIRFVFLPIIVAAACGGGDDDGGDPVPLFPADYASTYTEVRDCRRSGDHELNFIRILADPSALGPYRDRLDPFPEDSIVLKVEHDPADDICAEPPVRFTVMVKLADGAAPDKLDWRWQDVTADRTVESEDQPLCYNCHTGCGEPPDGYDGTCAVP